MSTGTTHTGGLVALQSGRHTGQASSHSLSRCFLISPNRTLFLSEREAQNLLPESSPSVLLLGKEVTGIPRADPGCEHYGADPEEHRAERGGLWRLPQVPTVLTTLCCVINTSEGNATTHTSRPVLPKRHGMENT